MVFTTLNCQVINILLERCLAMEIDVEERCRFWKLASKVLCITETVRCAGSFLQDISCNYLRTTGDLRIGKRCNDVVVFKCLFCLWLIPPCDMSLVCKSKANGNNDHGSSWHGGKRRSYDLISLGVILFEDFLPELFPFDFFCLLFEMIFFHSNEIVIWFAQISQFSSTDVSSCKAFSACFER